MNPWTTLVIPILLICGAAALIKCMMNAAAWADQMDKWHYYEMEQRRKAERKAEKRLRKAMKKSPYNWAVELENEIRALPETKEPVS